MTQEYSVKDRILNCVPSKGTDRDWTVETAASAGLLAAPTAIPAAVDLREPWWTIGDQMDSGSCVGWGTGDGVLRWHFVKKGKLLSNQPKPSVRYIWMAAKEMDEFSSYPSTFIEFDGTSLKAALEIARKYGVVTEDILPFRVPDSKGVLANETLYRGGSAQTFFALAAKLRIASYYNLAAAQATKLATWKNWLAANGGPILTALGVDATWDNAKNTKGKLDVYQPNTVRGGHCVAIVGYTQDRFIIRNSWGTGWGDNGFAYASNAYAQAAFNEAYGVAVNP